jgi:starch synthase (maltosyl-transferring)
MDDMSKVRVVIENITPQVDCGRFPIKRTVGETVLVEADVFTDGHDAVTAMLLYQHENSQDWHSVPMRAIGNDRWQARFTVQLLGTYRYTISAWVDYHETWRHGLQKKYEAGQDIELELRRGAALAFDIASRATSLDAQRLHEWADEIVKGETTTAATNSTHEREGHAPSRAGDPSTHERDARVAVAQSEAIRELAQRYPDPATVLRWDSPLPVEVDRERARFSTWYEMFPRSASAEPGKHGTFADVEKLLPYVASMGFDVLYLPPIHPIGTTERKGPNNNPSARPGDPGSPWAIGASAGGHKAIHPELGTLDELKRLIAKAAEHDIEIALDIAFQTTPDHPYVREHPEWFLKRPDGTIQYAENPPKKYQDIYPFYFESDAGRELAVELRSVVEYWIAQGVSIFRVDNPHTKPFPFWEELIRQIRRQRPDVIFLAEAFTRPKMLYRLAKLGFTQSYNYFPWRNTKRELMEYFTELGTPPVSEFFRANLWPNTPDILPEYLQFAGRGGFMVRLVLAATLGASYGIYGPAFELMQDRPREPGSEEYLDSEKYEIRHRDFSAPGNIVAEISALNRLRKSQPALQSHLGLTFYNAFNDQVMVYGKMTAAREDMVLVAVSLDPHAVQEAAFEVPLWEWKLPDDGAVEVEDLMRGHRFVWQGKMQRLRLDPADLPFAIWRIAPAGARP